MCVYVVRWSVRVIMVEVVFVTAVRLLAFFFPPFFVAILCLARLIVCVQQEPFQVHRESQKIILNLYVCVCVCVYVLFLCVFTC
jgi:hypothetical protein